MAHLYISDLDGTLLDAQAQVSARTEAILTPLLENGLLFTVSTARSPFSLQMVGIERLPLSLPVSLLNGVVLYEPATDRVVDFVPLNDWEQAVDMCAQYRQKPMLFRIENERLMVDYFAPETDEQRAFLEPRLAQFGDRYHLVENHHTPLHPLFLSMQNRYAVLHPLYEALVRSGCWRVTFYKDNYLKDTWFLEICGKDGGKGNALKRLKAYAHADTVTVFGDNLNDLPMFEAADETIAVANAHDAVKAVADRIIGAHTDDGVATYLQEVYTR